MATLVTEFIGPTDADQSLRSGTVLVWFEGGQAGRAALAHAHELTAGLGDRLAVLTIAVHERVIGCGRCLQGTVIWNLEMDKLADEELREARHILDGATGVTYERAIGNPAEVINAEAARLQARTVVIPRQRNRRLDPPNRRHIARKLADGGPWQVVSS